MFGNLIHDFLSHSISTFFNKISNRYLVIKAVTSVIRRLEQQISGLNIPDI